MNQKLVITEYQNCIADLLFLDFHLEELYLFPKEDIIGNIYVAIIKNIVKNLNAAFVEYETDKMAFLPLNKEQLSVFHEGDSVLIQIEKAAVKTKDPVATTNLSLNGLFTVVSTKLSSKSISCSKKISLNKKEVLVELFNKEKNIISLLNQKHLSAVLRSSVEQLDSYDILLQEIGELSNKLNEIIRKGKHRTAFSILYKNQDQYLKQILKFSSSDYDEIVTDYEYIYKACSKVLPDRNIRYYQESEYSLEKLYSISTNMDRILNKRVYLKNGGNIIIENTEALTVIDINTGKNIQKLKADELAYETNMEAAKEIAKQLILRNISGIIIVDFINMKNKIYMEKLISHVKNLCKKDKIQCDFIDITNLGLAELTRKKTSAPIYELLEV